MEIWLFFVCLEIGKLIKNFERGSVPGDGYVEKMARFYLVKGREISDQRLFNGLSKALLGWFKGMYGMHMKCEDKYFVAQITDKNFMTIRKPDTGADFVFQSLQLCLGLEVTPELEHSIDWIRFHEHFGTQMLLINELFSLMKEVKSGQGKLNYVFIKLKSNNLSVDEAVDQVVAEVKENECLTLEFGEKLKAFNNDCLNKYVEHCKECMYGNM